MCDRQREKETEAASVLLLFLICQSGTKTCTARCRDAKMEARLAKMLKSLRLNIQHGKERLDGQGRGSLIRREGWKGGRWRERGQSAIDTKPVR